MPSAIEVYDVLPGPGALSVSYPVDASADPYAGTNAGNGLPIWTPQEAADNLNRNEVDFLNGNYGVGDDGVLTYGFWTYEQFLDSYYFELVYSDGSAFNDDAYYAETYGLFEAFTAQQQAAVADIIELWDDLIAIDIVAAPAGEVADIMFGAVYMSPAAGAHAYYPQAEALDEFYGTEAYGLVSGDVMINWLYNSPTGDDAGTIVNRPADDSFSNLDPGAYGWFAITHELGHSLGLAHGGDYNASAGTTITYENDAYFYQDSQQYTIMSYFSGTVTGQAALDWGTGYFITASTPGVHDILAVQNVYGADYTTRAGNTVYGFNSTAGSSVFDFTSNTIPIVTIWDGGGKDTLDLSGFDADNVIDINEGAFSSAGFKISAEDEAFWGEYFGLETEEDFASFYAFNGLGPDGRPVDNIAIAYGAQIENAVGGTGNDLIIGNALGNMLSGGAGNDVLAGGAGKDELIGGLGNDLFVFTDADVGTQDKIRDFDSGNDMIDLTGFGGLDAGDVKISGNNLFVNTDGIEGYDLHIVVQGDRVEMSDIAFTDDQINLDNYVAGQDLFLAA